MVTDWSTSHLTISDIKTTYKAIQCIEYNTKIYNAHNVCQLAVNWRRGQSLVAHGRVKKQQQSNTFLITLDKGLQSHIKADLPLFSSKV